MTTDQIGVQPTTRLGRTVATSGNSRSLARGVKSLAEGGIPLASVSIVATGISDDKAAARGKLSTLKEGLVAGALVGGALSVVSIVALSSSDWWRPATLLFGVLLGAVTGAVIGPLVRRLASSGAPLGSLDVIAPENFYVVVRDEDADEAERLLSTRISSEGRSSGEVKVLSRSTAGEDPSDRAPRASRK